MTEPGCWPPVFVAMVAAGAHSYRLKKSGSDYFYLRILASADGFSFQRSQVEAKRKVTKQYKAQLKLS